MSKTNNNQFCLFIILISSHLKIGGTGYIVGLQIFSICWRPRCQSVLSTVASPASRGPEAAGWRKGGEGGGGGVEGGGGGGDWGRGVYLLLSQLSPFHSQIVSKINQVEGWQLQKTQLIFLSRIAKLLLHRCSAQPAKYANLIKYLSFLKVILNHLLIYYSFFLHAHLPFRVMKRHTL